MVKDCLYCGLQFSDTTHFCHNCGRPTESGFSIRPIQESEIERLRREVKEKDELIRQLVLTRTMRAKPPAPQPAQLVVTGSLAAMGGGRA